MTVDCLSYTILSSYGYANGFALKNYLESILLAIQGGKPRRLGPSLSGLFTEFFSLFRNHSSVYYQGIQRPFSLTLTLGMCVDINRLGYSMWVN